MADTPKHTKITTYQTQEDGSVKKRTQAYHEQLASILEERIDSIQTTHQTFLADIMKCLEPINTGKTQKLNIEIKADTYKNPTMIVRSFVTYKEEFKRR